MSPVSSTPGTSCWMLEGHRRPGDGTGTIGLVSSPSFRPIDYFFFLECRSRLWVDFNKPPLSILGSVPFGRRVPLKGRPGGLARSCTKPLSGVSEEEFCRAYVIRTSFTYGTQIRTLLWSTWVSSKDVLFTGHEKFLQLTCFLFLFTPL